MERIVNKEGPWVLQNSPDLGGLVERLSTHLPLGASVHLVEYDSYNLPHGKMDAGHTQMSAEEPVHIRQRYGPSSQPQLYIPIGIGIFVPTQPIEFADKLYAAIVDIQGDYIYIQVPYLFGESPERVDVKLYTIITRK